MIFHGRPVTVDRVKEAYAKVNFVPEAGRWMAKGESCCALSALVLADGVYAEDEWRETTKFASSAMVSEALNMDRRIVMAFTIGFDGEDLYWEKISAQEQEAYDLGQQVAEAVF